MKQLHTTVSVELSREQNVQSFSYLDSHRLTLALLILAHFNTSQLNKEKEKKRAFTIWLDSLKHFFVSFFCTFISRYILLKLIPVNFMRAYIDNTDFYFKCYGTMFNQRQQTIFASPHTVWEVIQHLDLASVLCLSAFHSE